ncbi:DUF4236 domain-containing protein [Arthrobacter sp. 2RAF22]|uniref:DUF4236 domain-containing protein n=1 Tax=Arthrobacter sp. 2RAF22 TaxID=3232996 RepID=UPI003F90271B
MIQVSEAGEGLIALGFIFRKRVRLGKSGHVNISKSGASVSEQLAPVTVNSRGRVTVRLLPGLSFRFGGRRRR